MAIEECLVEVQPVLKADSAKHSIEQTHEDREHKSDQKWENHSNLKSKHNFVDHPTNDVHDLKYIQVEQNSIKTSDRTNYPIEFISILLNNIDREQEDGRGRQEKYSNANINERILRMIGIYPCRRQRENFPSPCNKEVEETEEKKYYPIQPSNYHTHK